MPPTIVQSFSDTAVKIRFGETYVSDGLNAKMAGVVPRGIYRGFQLVPSVAPLTVQLDPDSALLHLAVYETLTGRSLTLRVSGGSIPISLGAFAGTRVYIAVFAEYAVGSPTTAELRVYSVADYNGAAEKDELVVLGVVDVPGAGVIPSSAVVLSERTLPWTGSALRPWKQVVRNGGFEDAVGSCGGLPTDLQGIPGFSGEESNNGNVTTNPASQGPVRSGGYALKIALPLTTSLVRLGSGEFSSAGPLSGDLILVRAGQLVDVSLWVAGVTVEPYTQDTNGLRMIVEFYDSTFPLAVLQSTEVLASDAATHVGSFGYAQLAGVFVAPADGYFRWYLDATVDLAAGASEFWVDDIRIFLEPGIGKEDDPESTRVPALVTTRLDILTANETARQSQNNQSARLTAETTGLATYLRLTKAGQRSELSIPRWVSPYIYEKFDPAATPLIGILGSLSTADQDVPAHEYMLLHTYGASFADGTLVRVFSRTVDGEYVITSNARWGGGGAQHWIPDNTALDAMKFSCGASGPRWESKDGVLPATWLDSAWDGTVGAGTGLAQLLFAATLAVNHDDATVPLITTSKDPSDHPATPLNPFKLLAAFPTGMSGVFARLYSGQNDLLGNFMVTLNAAWSPSGSNWTADSIVYPALRYNVLLNAVSSYFSIDSRAVTTLPWTENPGGAWDISPTAGFGDYKTMGQYDWLYSRTFTYLLPIQGAVPYADASGAVLWRLSVSGGVTLWTALATELAFLEYPLELPQDVTLTRVRVIVGNTADSGVGIDVGYDSGYDFASPVGAVSHTSLNAPSAPNVIGAHTITASMSHVIDKTNRHYMIRVSADTIGDDVFAFEVRFVSPGLRGY